MFELNEGGFERRGEEREREREREGVEMVRSIC
jgi:hypothetical protein